MEAKSRRYAGHAGISSRQNEPDSIDASGEKPFTTRNAASQPPRRAATAPRRTRTTASSPANGAHCASRWLQKNSRSCVHLVAPVLEVDVEVAVELQVDRERARSHGDTRLVEGERRNLTQPTHLPEQEDEQRGSDRDAAREALAPAARDDVREERARSDEQVRRLQAPRPRR